MALEELSRYRISGKIGEGAMGVVYRAFDPLLERVVAVKTIKLDFSPSEEDEFERRFFREAKSAARLSHPNIVTVFDAGKFEDVAYIAMEFLEGRDLRQLMNKKEHLPVARIVEIVASVADGLAYAHEHGVVHRDIKPANIMVLDKGGVKIADFGIAQIQTGTRTMGDMIVGTSKYMSPEHIMGLPVDGRTDIFSLGVVLYQLLTGVTPFEGETVTTIMYRVIHEAAAAPSLVADDIPSGFEYILSKALAKKPENRYQTAAEFASDLRGYEALATTPRLPWLVGGIGDPAPATAAGDPIFSAETIRMAAPAAPIALRVTPAEALPDAAPQGESASGREPVRARSGAFRLIFASLGILLLIGAGVFLATREKSPDDKSAASTQAAAGTTAPKAAPEPVVPVAGTATLSLAVSPWGEIFVDGESKGVSPPMLSLEVPAGKHTIEIKNDGASNYSTEVELKDGEVKRLKYKF